jgi:hypothetical protein
MTKQLPIAMEERQNTRWQEVKRHQQTERGGVAKIEHQREDP